MAHFSYNGVSEKRSFNQWCADHGIEVVKSWDMGMYGNIGFKVLKDGVEYEASGYQSTGMSSNFTFNLVVKEAA